MKQETITYVPDKRPAYEKNAPKGEHFWCRFHNGWVKKEEFEREPRGCKECHK